MDASIVHLCQKKCWVKNWQFWWSTTFPGFFRLRRRIENLGGFWKYQKKRDESPGWWFWSGKRNSQNNPKNGRMIQVDELVEQNFAESICLILNTPSEIFYARPPPRMACVFWQDTITLVLLPAPNKTQNHRSTPALQTAAKPLSAGKGCHRGERRRGVIDGRWKGYVMRIFVRLLGDWLVVLSVRYIIIYIYTKYYYIYIHK